MASFTLRPSGTYVGELDLAIQAKAISTSLGAAVITTRRGPEEDRFQTRVEVFDQLYGPPDASWSYAHYCIRKFLPAGQGCWLTRVTNQARFAGGIIFNDQEGSQANTTFFRGFGTGRYLDYKSGSQELINFRLSGPLSANQTITASFTDGTTPGTASAKFDGVINTTSDQTLAALMRAMMTQINNLYSQPGENSGQAFVNTVGFDGSDDRVLTAVSPEGVNLTFTAFNTTRQTGDTTSVLPTVTEFDDGTVLEIYAENRGKWASDPYSDGVGIRFSNVDNGTNARIAVQFTQALVTGQSLSITFTYHDPITNAQNDKTITVGAVGSGPILDHATAMTSLMQQFEATYPGGDAFLLDNNPLELIFVAPEAGPDTLGVSSSVVNQPVGNNASQPTITVSEVLEGIASTQSFDIEVYTRSDINNPIETRTCSLVHSIDGNGNQLYIEDVINNNSSSRSNYIRVRHNPHNLAGILNILPSGTDIYWLTGGDDGVLPTSGDIIRTWNNYADRQTRPARIFINCGYTALPVQQKMAALAKSRYDAIAILDWPSDLQQVQAAFDYRMTKHNLNTSYAAAYLPDVLIQDEINNKQLYVPPSGHMAAIYANTDNVAASWFAPAGLNRAILDDALGLRELYNQNDMGLLITGQLNPIINRGGDIVAWEQFTLYRKTSPFQNVSLRRLLILVEVSVADGLDYTIHEPNDDYTGMLIVQVAISILEPIKNGRGLYAYAAVSDDRNNSNYDFDRQNRNLDVLMDPILPIRTIQLTSVVTRKGASFAEVLNALSGNVANATVS